MDLQVKAAIGDLTQSFTKLADAATRHLEAKTPGASIYTAMEMLQAELARLDKSERPAVTKDYIEGFKYALYVLDRDFPF